MAVSGKETSKQISSTLSLGGAEDFDIFCEIHDRSYIRLPAFGYCVDCEEHLCQHCFNTHKGPRPLRHHQLLDKDHMPHKQNLHKSSQSSSVHKAELTKSCPKHTKEVIKFFCHDHKLLICSVCVALEHTPTSCHVDYIPDVSEHYLDSTEFKETLKDINQLTDKCIQITKSLKERVAKSTTSFQDAIVEIENFRKEINRRLDELEKEVKDTATTIEDDNKKKLETTETTCEGINKSLQASADTLKLLNSSKKADQLFTEMKIAKQLIIENEIRTTHLPKATDVDEYTFEPNPAIKALLQNEKSLGTLREKKQKQPVQPKNQLEVPMKLSTHRNIHVKTASDDYFTCHITSITVSPQNQIFVVDCKNKSIKMIDIYSGAIKQLKFESRPWDVTMIDKDTLAVTLPDNETIQFISFSSNSLSLTKKFQVTGWCQGISHHQGKLAVTFEKPAKLQIIDLKSVTCTTITVEKDADGDNIFGNPGYVTTNSYSIYVSDHHKQAIMWFNWQGEMLGRYTKIKDTSGIALLDDGSFLVNDYHFQCIYKVSGDCKNSEIILNVEGNPQALCWCSKTRTLCVSTRNGSLRLYQIM